MPPEAKTKNLSMALALTLAGPISSRTSANTSPLEACKGVSLYKGISDRPLGWKPRTFPTKTTQVASTSGEMSMRRWDGATRSSTEWDCLRRDPELWYPEGNCLVYLHGRGQSKRGPAFRVSMDALLAGDCNPLLDRFMVHDVAESPVPDSSKTEGKACLSQPNSRLYEIYIPRPAAAQKEQIFLYHMATRNFFAWVFRKSLIGTHLGGALVGLLNSMMEFRLPGQDSVQDIMDYMDEEGYADMRSSPDHALALLFFAEKFQFKDLWIDAFAHCVGMHEKLASSPEFEFMSRTSRALITRSRLEMNVRLEIAGRKLGSFLSDDLSDAHLGLTPGARAHLDKFRSFLLSYYVAKFGYYPPTSGTVSKKMHSQMRGEFQALYDFLVDTEHGAADIFPLAQQGGICVFQSVQDFDARHKYPSLPHPWPLLPEVDDASMSWNRFRLSRRLNFPTKTDKMKPDPRLVAFASLNKATNRHDQSLTNCGLVRAYRDFETECFFSPSKADKNDKLSQSDARKARWILIYSILQTLLSITGAPEQVRDTQNVPYHLCVLTAGCPPWKVDRPLEILLCGQTDKTKNESTLCKTPSATESGPRTLAEIKPDIDYFARTHRATPMQSAGAKSTTPSRKGTVRRALSTLGNMPELRHPKPLRASFHEILIYGYGNGTNNVNITSDLSIHEDDEDETKLSSNSNSSSQENLSSGWSNVSGDADEFDSPRSSLSAGRRDSDISKKSIKEFLDSPFALVGIPTPSRSVYSQSVYENSSLLQPDPLSLTKGSDTDCVKVVTEVKVEWEDDEYGKVNEELLQYLQVE